MGLFMQPDVQPDGITVVSSGFYLISKAVYKLHYNEMFKSVHELAH